LKTQRGNRYFTEIRKFIQINPSKTFTKRSEIISAYTQNVAFAFGHLKGCRQRRNKVGLKLVGFKT